MTKAFWVNTFRSVSDPQKVASYAELAGSVMTDHGGVFLARGMPVEVFERGVMERTVVIEFPSVGHALSAYRSDAYQAALSALGDGAERDIRIVEAVT